MSLTNTDTRNPMWIKQITKLCFFLKPFILYHSDNTIYLGCLLALWGIVDQTFKDSCYKKQPRIKGLLAFEEWPLSKISIHSKSFYSFCCRVNRTTILTDLIGPLGALTFLSRGLLWCVKERVSNERTVWNNTRILFGRDI